MNDVIVYKLICGNFKNRNVVVGCIVYIKFYCLVGKMI